MPRFKVAETCVEALFNSSAQNKVVEIVAQEEAAAKPYGELFAGVV